jgi:hypothetical protein
LNNSYRGLIEIDLDGRRRHLRYPMNSLIALKEQAGLESFELFDGLSKDGPLTAEKLKLFRFLLWAGLIHEDPELTVDQVGNMVELGDFAHLQLAILKSYSGAMRAPGEKKREDAGGAESGTGTRPSNSASDRSDLSPTNSGT